MTTAKRNLSEYTIVKVIGTIVTALIIVSWAFLNFKIENQGYRLSEKFVLKSDYNNDRQEILAILRRIEEKIDYLQNSKQDKITK